MAGLGTLLRDLQLIVPRPVMIAIVALVAVIGLPVWWRLVRTRQMKSVIKRASVASTSDERRGLEDEAFELARGATHKLVAAAEEGMRLNLKGLAEKSLAELERTGQVEAAQDIRRRLGPPPPPAVAHPLEAALAVRRLLHEGLVGQASQRLAEARARFPDDPDLAALAAEIAAPRPRAGA